MGRMSRIGIDKPCDIVMLAILDAETINLSKLHQVDQRIRRCDSVFALIRGGEAWRANLG